MFDVARDENSPFSAVKYLFTSAPEGIVNLVTTEQSGRMRHVQIQRNFLGKYQHVSNSLLKNVKTIDVQKPIKRNCSKTDSTD